MPLEALSYRLSQNQQPSNAGDLPKGSLINKLMDPKFSNAETFHPQSQRANFSLSTAVVSNSAKKDGKIMRNMLNLQNGSVSAEYFAKIRA